MVGHEEARKEPRPAGENGTSAYRRRESLIRPPISCAFRGHSDPADGSAEFT